MEILFKNKNVVVVYKPPALSSQQDKIGDTDAMTETSSDLRARGEEPSLWLVHRLDKVVGGLLVFARNKNSAAKLSELVKGRGIAKEYLAVVDGAFDGSGIMKDYLFKDIAKNKAFIVDRMRAGVKEAELEYSALERVETEKGTKTLVKVTLVTGRFHQIRAQFASRKLSLTGDGKYGSKDNLARFPSLFAYHLSFALSGDSVDVYKYPDRDTYPWSLFSEEHFK